MIEKYLGIPLDYIVIGMAAVIIILIILLIVFITQMSKLKKRYRIFMRGKNAKSLEDTLIYRLDQIDELNQNNATNERNINLIFSKLEGCFQRSGLVKYDAFNEMGGKLSFAYALLDEEKSGVIINSVHSREGSYTYIKEVIGGNPVHNLSNEEAEALETALKE